MGNDTAPTQGLLADPDTAKASTLDCATALRRIGDVPRDVGWLLVTAGVIGEIAPGVFGTPFWVMGSLILWPNVGQRVESWLEAHSPKLLRGGMKQVGRFLDDLDRRYPADGKPGVRRDRAEWPGGDGG